MNIAVLSDIHSNSFALKAVLNEVRERKIERLFVLGDIFGYYPWATETYKLLVPWKDSGAFIKGNHDQLLLEKNPPQPSPSYWEAAKQNKRTLDEEYPEAINWLESLNTSLQVNIDGMEILMVHGTPGDEMYGRYYPDDNKIYDWFPRNGSVLLMGHTHYPLYRSNETQGQLINPGSVGQPRDGNPMPSWGILNTIDGSFEFIRTPYDNLEAMEILKARHWEKRAIASLNKTNSGSLQYE